MPVWRAEIHLWSGRNLFRQTEPLLFFFSVKGMVGAVKK